MKSLLLSLVLVIATQVNAAGKVELGKYKAVDVETKQISADLELKADGKITLTIKTPDVTVPCAGDTYNVTENIFTTKVNCESDILASANVKIDITNVTPEGLRSKEGVVVDVTIAELSEEPAKYNLKKND